jgi:hypothetical protein
MPKAAATVSGPLTAVPCAHCGRPQDYTVVEERLVEEGAISEIPRGAQIECDECGRLSEVVDVRKVAVVRQA